MKTAVALIYLTLIAALTASNLDRYSPLWGACAAAVVVFFVAALLRILLVVNAPGSDE
ncbi:MAG: hypothetical protein V4755_05325 [Curtobacterium sp.]